MSDTRSKLLSLASLTTPAEQKTSFSLLAKAKGDVKAGHKYKRRKPDGRGGWLYDYGKGWVTEKKSEKKSEPAAKTSGGGACETKPKLCEGLEAGVKARIDKYNLQVLHEAGSDPSVAVEVAKRLEAGIDKNADVCKQSPPVCAGNMGIPRRDMPQIMDESVKSLLNATKKGQPDEGKRKKGRAAVAAGADPNSDISPMEMMLDHFKSEGIAVGEPETVKVSSMMATQKDIQAAKTNMFAEWQMEGKFPGGKPADFTKDPIIMSKDGHILDGHHRYAAMLMLGPDVNMKAIVVDLPMHELLAKSFEVPGAGVFRMDLQNNVVEGPTPNYKEYKQKADAKKSAAGGDVQKGNYLEWLSDMYHDLGLLI